jgi:DNA-binding NarL/FixJ family response regulator
LRLLLIEDHAAMRDALRMLLKQDHDVVGEVCNGLEAQAAIESLKPDILLLDISLPDTSGFKIAGQLQKTGTPIKIIFVTQHRESIYLEEAKRLKVPGYVFKDRIGIDLLSAIQEVSRGGIFASPNS